MRGGFANGIVTPSFLKDVIKRGILVGSILNLTNVRDEKYWVFVLQLAEHISVLAFCP